MSKAFTVNGHSFMNENKKCTNCKLTKDDLYDENGNYRKDISVCGDLENKMSYDEKSYNQILRQMYLMINNIGSTINDISIKINNMKVSIDFIENHIDERNEKLEKRIRGEVKNDAERAIRNME